MYCVCEMDRPGRIPLTLFCDGPEVESDGGVHAAAGVTIRAQK